MNDYVGEEIQQALDEEEQFYKSNDRDRLKTPPYVYVKRLPRSGIELPVRQTAASGTKNQKRTRSKSKENLSISPIKDIKIDGVLGEDENLKTVDDKSEEKE